MKYKIFLLIFSGSMAIFSLNAQKRFSIQAGAGYKIYKYDLENYKQASAIPFYIRATTRIGLLEVGGEYSGDASPVTYYFEDPNITEERFTEKHQQTYYGGFVGVNTSKGQKTGIFLRAGAGMNNLTKNIKLADGKTYLTQKLEATLELKGMAGVSIKLAKGIFLNAEGIYGMVMKRKKSDFAADLRVKNPDTFSITSYGGLLGISFHF